MHMLAHDKPTHDTSVLVSMIYLLATIRGLSLLVTCNELSLHIPNPTPTLPHLDWHYCCTEQLYLAHGGPL
jgi:hypothetical protein